MSVTHPYFSKSFSKSYFFAVLFSFVASIETPAHAAEPVRLSPIQDSKGFNVVEGALLAGKHLFLYGMNNHKPVVQRNFLNGALDTSFGYLGSLFLNFPSHWPIKEFPSIFQAHLLGNDHLVIVGTISHETNYREKNVFIAKVVLKTGEMDTSFGNDGFLSIGKKPNEMPNEMKINDSLLMEDGNMIVAIARSRHGSESHDVDLMHVNLQGRGDARNIKTILSSTLFKFVAVPPKKEGTLEFKFLSGSETVNAFKTVFGTLTMNSNFMHPRLRGSRDLLEIGVHSVPGALRALPDGRIVAHVYVTSFDMKSMTSIPEKLRNQNYRSAIALLNPEGELDMSFGLGGLIFNSNENDLWNNMHVIDGRVFVFSRRKDALLLFKLNTRNGDLSHFITFPAPGGQPALLIQNTNKRSWIVGTQGHGNGQLYCYSILNKVPSTIKKD